MSVSPFKRVPRVDYLSPERIDHFLKVAETDLSLAKDGIISLIPPDHRLLRTTVVSCKNHTELKTLLHSLAVYRT